MQRFTRCLETPLGPLRLVATHDAIVAVEFTDPESRDNDRRVDVPEATDVPVLVRAAEELAEYFDGERSSFTVPCRLEGTAFQRRVWAELATIPYGQTRSYADIARAVGHPSAFRAVGATNGQNPIAIIVPCHRVIGSSGALTGYAGGIVKKRWLLTLEQRVATRIASGSPSLPSEPTRA